jgi:hypothetical protein
MMRILFIVLFIVVTIQRVHCKAYYGRMPCGKNLSDNLQLRLDNKLSGGIKFVCIFLFTISIDPCAGAVLFFTKKQRRKLWLKSV